MRELELDVGGLDPEALIDLSSLSRLRLLRLSGNDLRGCPCCEVRPRPREAALVAVVRGLTDTKVEVIGPP